MQHKPAIKPSARIAARAATHQPSFFSRSHNALKHLLLDAIQTVERGEDAERTVLSLVGIDAALLIRHLRGEIGVMRGLLKEAHNYMLEDLDESPAEIEAGSAREARLLTDRMGCAIHDALLSEQLLRKKP